MLFWSKNLGFAHVIITAVLFQAAAVNGQTVAVQQTQLESRIYAPSKSAAKNSDRQRKSSQPRASSRPRRSTMGRVNTVTLPERDNLVAPNSDRQRKSSQPRASSRPRRSTMGRVNTVTLPERDNLVARNSYRLVSATTKDRATSKVEDSVLVAETSLNSVVTPKVSAATQQSSRVESTVTEGYPAIPEGSALETATPPIHLAPPAPRVARAPIPSQFADPDQFRVDRSTAPTRKPLDSELKKKFLIQREVARSSRPSQPGTRTRDDDSSINLPTPDLLGGIKTNSMLRAVVNRDIPDPNQAFLTDPSTTMASDYRDGAVPVTKTWRTPNLVHQPLYFEQGNLERYGHAHKTLQPFLSGAHFFSTVALLPYKTGVSPPRSCESPLGHYRPGKCNPAYRNGITLDRKAALRQALVVGAVISGL